MKTMLYAPLICLAALVAGCGTQGSNIPTEEALCQTMRDNADDFWAAYDAMRDYQTYYPEGRYICVVDSIDEVYRRGQIMKYFDTADTARVAYFPKSDFATYIERHSQSPNARQVFDRYDSVWNAAIAAYRERSAKADPAARQAMIGLMEYMRDNRLRNIYLLGDFDGDCKQYTAQEKAQILADYGVRDKSLCLPSNSSFKKTERDLINFGLSLKNKIFYDQLPQDFVKFEWRENKYTRIDSVCPMLRVAGRAVTPMQRIGGKELPVVWVVTEKKGAANTIDFCLVGIEFEARFFIEYPVSDTRFEAKVTAEPAKDKIDTYRLDGYLHSDQSMMYSCINTLEAKIETILGVR